MAFSFLTYPYLTELMHNIDLKMRIILVKCNKAPKGLSEGMTFKSVFLPENGKDFAMSIKQIQS